MNATTNENTTSTIDPRPWVNREIRRLAKEAAEAGAPWVMYRNQAYGLAVKYGSMELYNNLAIFGQSKP